MVFQNGDEFLNVKREKFRDSKFLGLCGLSKIGNVREKFSVDVLEV